MTNNEAIGYTAIAMKELGFTKEQIEKVTNEMYYQFDTKTEQEADDHRRHILNGDPLEK
jgi:hypothetical protein